MAKKKSAAHTRLINQALDRLEKDYNEARRDELALLHNGFVEVMNELGASPQNVLLVLKVLEWVTMEESIKKFFPNRAYVRMEVVEAILEQELENRTVEVVDELPKSKPKTKKPVTGTTV